MTDLTVPSADLLRMARMASVSVEHSISSLRHRGVRAARPRHRLQYVSKTGEDSCGLGRTPVHNKRRHSYTVSSGLDEKARDIA